MGRAMWQADSGHLLVPLDLPYEEYHGAQWFHAQLTKSGLNDPSIFDLATEGATTADMYLLCDKLLRTKRQPKLIIYGAAARDVSGCLFNCERNTPTFKLLFEPEDCHRLGHLFTTCWDEQLELEIYQLFPLHQNREAVKQLLLKNMAAITSSFVGHSLIVEPGFQNANAAADRKTDMNARFGSSATKDKRRLNNHLICLKLISQWAKERGIFLLIVNMPMLVGSFKETEIYKDYKKTIDECADDKQTFLLDLKDRPEFVNDCFYDGAHLNNKGSTKFIHYLTDWLNGHPYVLKNTQANLNIPHRFSNLSFASSN
jgi:hypothetical protein